MAFDDQRRWSASSDSSSSTSATDQKLYVFNKLLSSSIVKHWAQFKKHGHLLDRGRSLSDAGLSTIVANEAEQSPKRSFLTVPDIQPRRSLQLTPKVNHHSNRPLLPEILVVAAAAAGEGVADSDGSDAERRPAQFLRVPASACHNHNASTGNFVGGGGSGCAGAGPPSPRSAPATPLQLEPQTRPPKLDKHGGKSAPSLHRAGMADEHSECKAPSKARQKKFLRNFPQVGPEERVINYYSCALVGDILLQGHLYITKNYFAFYSNVFGYVTRLLIPTSSVMRISKEKMARIIPNAVAVSTRNERHVFGSLLSRDTTYKLMLKVWKASGAIEMTEPVLPPDLHISEVELDASEYSPEEESSSGAESGVKSALGVAGVGVGVAGVGVGGAAVIQPALLTGAAAPPHRPRAAPALLSLLIMFAFALFTVSALVLSYKLYNVKMQEWSEVSEADMLQELMRWRSELHGRAASELHAFLSTNMLLISKVRQSLETLSTVLLADFGHAEPADFGHAEPAPPVLDTS